jgi:hypothetical protein
VEMRACVMSQALSLRRRSKIAEKFQKFTDAGVACA